MRKHALFIAIFVVLGLFVSLAGCRRDEEEETPTVVPTAVIPEGAATDGAPPTPAEVTAATATPAPEPEPARIDPGEIDWAPQVVHRSPEPGQETLLDGAITIRFDQPMNRSSVEEAFEITSAPDAQDGDAAGAVAGDFEWPRPDTLIFTPRSSLRRSERYRVQIGTNARGENGQSLQDPVELDFETVGYLDVAQVIPNDGAQAVSPDSSITVLFNRPVVPLVSTAQQDELPQPLEIEPAVEGSGEWVSTSIYRFTPSEALSGATGYEVTIPSGLEDVTGNVLESDFTWRFTTARPSVATIEPSTGTTDVIPTSAMTVTFSTPMDQGSVESAISLEPAHALQYEWQEDGRTLVINPQGRLELGTRYTLTVGDSALGRAGQATLDRETSSTFETVPLPGVRETTPRQGEEAQAYQFGISIEFVSPMDPETIDGRIEINPAPEEEPDYFINPNGRYVSLSFELQRNTRYEVTIPGDVADPYGNTLGEAYTWSFTTAPLAPLASLNLPWYVAQFSRAFPTTVTVLHRNVSTVNANLYDVDLPVGLLVEPGRIGEFTPDGPALRNWSLPADAPLDEVGEIDVDLAGAGETLPNGIYLLTASAPEVDPDRSWWQNQRTLLVVGDTNIVVKETFGGVHVWVTDLSSGEPVAGRELALYDANGSRVGSATSSSEGFATFDYRPPQDFLEGVVVVSGEPGQSGFGVGGSQWNQGASPWQFDVPYTGSEELPEFAYIYTDRPIYRPGDTVHYRGILRDANYARYNLPQRDSVEVRVEFASFYEPSQTLDYQVSLPLNENGTFSGDFEVPDDAALGRYRIYLENEATIANAGRTFTVADYRAPEFEVSVTPDVEETLRGETVDVVVEARYFFGAPASDLPVQWTIREMPYRLPWDGPYYSFDDDDSFTFQYGADTDFFGRYVTDGQGRTDADGRLVITLPADLLADAENGGRTVTVEATIRDLSEFPVSATGQVVFHAAETYVGVAPQDYLNSADSENTVKLITVDWDGNPVPNQEVEVTFYEREYEYVRDSQFGGGFGRWEPNDTEVEQVTVTTDDEGQAQASFVPEQGGTYRALATVSDAAGRSHSSSTLFWVSSGGFVDWRMSPEEKRMDMTPDQRTYEVGDTARILVQSPFAGPVNAWLTIERGTLLEQRLVTLESNSEVLEIPIAESLSPNVFISLVAIQGADSAENQAADIRLGVTELVVPPDRFQLNVELAPRSDVSAPGETVTYDIRVTDYAGQPVQAELSLALVDLAVLTLKEDNAPDISEAFYQRQPYRSEVGSGLFVSGEGLDVEVPQEELGRGGGGGGGGIAEGEAVALAQEEDEEVRRDFPDTAFWRASLTTDENGEATVEIPLPDSVTTWRLSSKAVTSDSRVGQAQVDIVATLPLLVRPVTPRFFTVNDVVQLGAIVNNNSAQPLDVTVSLEAEGLTLSGEAAQEISVPANNQQLVRWEATVEDVTAADLTFRAEAGEYSDATKPTFGVGPDQLIPVYRYDAEDVVGTSGVIDEPGRQVEAVLLPPQVDTREGSVEVQMSASLAAAVIEALDYVESEDLARQCPHSVVSHFLPNLATARALDELGLEDAGLERRVDALVEEAIDRLAQLQKSDGGWGWCFSAESDDNLTAYVLFGLAKARQAGFDLGDVALERAVRRLAIRDPQDLGEAWEANRQAWFLYVRAELGEANEEALDALFTEHRELLDPYAQAYLALAYEILGGDQGNRQTLLSDLSSDAIVSATGAHWEDAQRDWRNLSSNIRGTAVVIDALARIEADHALAPQAVRWLMSARTASHWTTPFETAWSVLALTDWMVATGELEAEFDYTLNVNGQDVKSGNFDHETIAETAEASVPMQSLLEDEVNYLIFQHGQGPGRLYYSTHLDAFVNAESVQAINRGMEVQRSYYDADCDPEEETCEPITEIEAGQRVRVQLTLIAPTDLTYLRLRDALPAGAEAIDPGLETSAAGFGGEVERDEYRYGYWGWWYFNRIEYRDESVIFYSDFLPAGTYQYTYFLEPNIPGQFQVRPAIAYEEFFPEVFGRSDGARFTIQENE